MVFVNLWVLEKLLYCCDVMCFVHFSDLISRLILAQICSSIVEFLYVTNQTSTPLFSLLWNNTKKHLSLHFIYWYKRIAILRKIPASAEVFDFIVLVWSFQLRMCRRVCAFWNSGMYGLYRRLNNRVSRIVSCLKNSFQNTYISVQWRNWRNWRNGMIYSKGKGGRGKNQ